MTDHNVRLSFSAEHPLQSRLAKRELWIFGEIDDNEFFTRTVSWLYHLLDESATDPITVYVNSPGGSVESALSIQTLIESADCPIITVAAGACHSAALAIYIAGDLRLALPGSFFLVHAMTYMSQGSLEETQAMAEYIKRLIDEEVDRLVAKTKWTKRKWSAAFSGSAKTNFYHIDDMIDAGVVHHKVKSLSHMESLKAEFLEGLKE